MDTNSVLKFFRLNDAPWFLIAGSVVALLTSAAWVFNVGTPTASVAWLFTTMGIPAAGAADAVHNWFVNPVRNTILLGALWSVLGVLVVVYAWAVYCIDESFANVRQKVRILEGARAAQFDDRQRLVSSEKDRTERVKTAEVELRSEQDYREAVRKYYLGRISRIASAVWFIVALVVEAGGFTAPWLIGLVVVFVVSIWIAVLAAGFGVTFSARVQSLVTYVAVAVISLFFTAVGVILFFLNVVVTEPPRRDRPDVKVDGEAKEEGQPEPV